MVPDVKMVASALKGQDTIIPANVLKDGTASIVKMKLMNVHRHHVKMVEFALINSQDIHVPAAWVLQAVIVKKQYSCVKIHHVKTVHCA